MALVTTDVSEERTTSIIRVKEISKLFSLDDGGGTSLLNAGSHMSQTAS
jgi:hypothetical protein